MFWGQITTISVPIKSKSTERDLTMSKTLTVGIQGKASSTIKDMGIISNLLKQKTGIDLKAIPEDFLASNRERRRHRLSILRI